MSASPAAARLRYTVVPARLDAHVFEVRLEIDPAGDPVLELALPGWLRGSYLVRDFAKHVFDLTVTRSGLPVRPERLDKARLRLPAGDGPVVVRYAVYAADESVRKAWLDRERGFFNASSLCYRVLGRDREALDLVIERPAQATTAPWRVATTLPAVAVDEQGFGRYRAADYEDLIDHPVEMAAFQRHDFEVQGIPHALVLSGRVQGDFARVCADLARICGVQRRFFGDQPALDQYLFLTHVVAAGYGGLEHRSSTALICSRGDFPRPGEAGLSREYRTFLGLASHEYFHLWNVKRITAQAFLESDLSREAYTRDLWHYEGVTSYYDDLFLLRAGVLEAASYLDVLAETATRLERTPGRHHHSLADASFETWIKYYQPDENSPNATTNYYVKGALVALCLDLTLRLRSTSSLDAVMQALWREYGATGIGVPEGGLAAMAQRLSGLDLSAEFEHWLHSTAELPLAELLAAFGVRAERRAATSALDEGGRTQARAQGLWAGLRLKPGENTVAQVLTDGPAQRAGLSAGDQLVALDGLRIGPNQWQRRLDAGVAGQPLTVHLFRGDELLERTLVPQPPPLDTWTLSLVEAVDPAVLARRQAWLGV
ncbi:MAG TPA: PDZ domain-containing protein [Nevskiaceae bacterium]|nr:PDZ domain-containing protein [Nevskiaceae bacterium]